MSHSKHPKNTHRASRGAQRSPYGAMERLLELKEQGNEAMRAKDPRPRGESSWFFYLQKPVFFGLKVEHEVYTGQKPTKTF